MLKVQAVGIKIAWVTKKRKVNKKPDSIKKETTETEFCLFDDQYMQLSESRLILYVKDKKNK